MGVSVLESLVSGGAPLLPNGALGSRVGSLQEGPGGLSILMTIMLLDGPALSSPPLNLPRRPMVDAMSLPSHCVGNRAGVGPHPVSWGSGSLE